MAKFIKIENKALVIPSVEIIRMLGASSSRGDVRKIGQFGSGFPYSLALLARHGLLDSLKLCLGNSVYTFEIKSHNVKDSSGNRFVKDEIVMKKQGGGSTNLNICTEFGEIDWKDVTMAVREFISNALDGADSYDSTYDSVRIEAVDEVGCRAKDGLIRVYIKMTEEIEEYYLNKEKQFLCLRPSYDKNARVVKNRDGGPARIYRRGVLVGEFGETSLFHYNLEDVQLNECRIVYEDIARTAAMETLRDYGDLSQAKAFLSEIVMTENPPTDEDGGIKINWEFGFSCSDMTNYDIRYENRETWKNAVSFVFDDIAVCDSDLVKEMVKKRGHRAVRYNYTKAQMLRTLGARQASDFLNDDDLNGRQVFPPNGNVLSVLDDVWRKLEAWELTADKAKPDIKTYAQITESQGASRGYWKDSCIYINRAHMDDRGLEIYHIMIHECAHYVTKANDYSPDFQEFLVKVAAKSMLA